MLDIDVERGPLGLRGDRDGQHHVQHAGCLLDPNQAVRDGYLTVFILILPMHSHLLEAGYHSAALGYSRWILGYLQKRFWMQ